MKLFLKAIAIGAEKRQSALAELNRLIDVAESSGLVVWHDNVCFKSSFWKWGKRTGTINWGGYGSSYRPENEKYFKFQYRGDSVKDGKLVIRKGAKPLDAVKALVLPEADTDGSIQKLMVDAGATVTVAGKGLKASAILGAAKQKKCNFILTADSVPKGLAEALDKATEAKTHIFMLPVSRLRFLLEKPKRAPVKRTVKKPVFSDADSNKAFAKLKSLLSSQKYEEIDHAITLLPGIPGACDKLLEGIALKKGVNAWINDEKSWKSGYGANRPQCWGHLDTGIPAKIAVGGDKLLLDEIPKNDLFTGSDARRYALMRVIDAAPDDCAAAKAIREGLVGLLWNFSSLSSSKPAKFPPLQNLASLKHLYFDLRHSSPSGTATLPASVVTLALESCHDIDWLPEHAGVSKLTVANSARADLKPLKKLRGLKEVKFEEEITTTQAESIPGAVESIELGRVSCDYSLLCKLMDRPRLVVGHLNVEDEEDNAGSAHHSDAAAGKTAGAPKLSAPKANKSEPLPAKQISAIKKLLCEDKPASALKGLALLQGASAATFDLLLGKADFSEASRWDSGMRWWKVQFFDALKKTTKNAWGSSGDNDLSDCLKITLISTAPAGCRVADAVRDHVKSLRLPSAFPITVDLSGLTRLEQLEFTIDLSKPECDHVKGLEKLVALKRVKVSFPYKKATRLPPKLNLPLPSCVEELSILADVHFSEVGKTTLPNLEFFPAMTNLKSVSVQSVESLASLDRFSPSPVARVQADQVLDSDLRRLPFKKSIVSLNGKFPKLTSLEGLEECHLLEELLLDAPLLADIDALEKLKKLRSVRLGPGGYYDRHGAEGPEPAAMPLSVLKNHAGLTRVDYGSHSPVDFSMITHFKSKPAIRLERVICEKMK